jgi:hypothetical protein
MASPLTEIFQDKECGRQSGHIFTTFPRESPGKEAGEFGVGKEVGDQFCVEMDLTIVELDEQGQQKIELKMMVMPQGCNQLF